VTNLAGGAIAAQPAREPVRQSSATLVAQHRAQATHDAHQLPLGAHDRVHVPVRGRRFLNEPGRSFRVNPDVGKLPGGMLQTRATLNGIVSPPGVSRRRIGPLR